jgi:hypothetical protein
MSRSLSSLWTAPPLDLASRIERCLDSARDPADGGVTGYIFFRADDVGIPGRQLVRLMELFTRYRVPLSLAHEIPLGTSQRACPERSIPLVLAPAWLAAPEPRGGGEKAGVWRE